MYFFAGLYYLMKATDKVHIMETVKSIPHLVYHRSKERIMNFREVFIPKKVCLYIIKLQVEKSYGGDNDI